MSDFIESKFRLDYRNFETLPTQLVNLPEFINSRIRQMEHIKKLKQEIDDLELSMTAETKMIADDILRQNIFPRFGGYSDFISHEYVAQEVIDSNPTFGNLATAVEMTANDFKDENKIYTAFEFQLENFIWLFFEGCGAWMVDDMKHKATNSLTMMEQCEILGKKKIGRKSRKKNLMQSVKQNINVCLKTT